MKTKRILSEIIIFLKPKSEYIYPISFALAIMFNIHNLLINNLSVL